jgi:hypothetical protein
MQRPNKGSKKKSPTLITQMIGTDMYFYAANRAARKAGNYFGAKNFETVVALPWRARMVTEKETGKIEKHYLVPVAMDDEGKVEFERVHPQYKPLGRRHANKQLAERIRREKEAS